MRGRMDLDGEIIAGIEDLHEQRKAGRIALQTAKDLGAMVLPQVVQGYALGGGAHGLGAIADLPSFTKRCGSIRQRAVKHGLQTTATPDAGLVKRREAEGAGEVHLCTKARGALTVQGGLAMMDA